MKQDITLKPGRELDALIAEHVMGLKQSIRTYSTSTFTETIWINESGVEKYREDDLPRYSEDIAAAWEIVEALKLLNCNGIKEWGARYDEFPIHIRFTRENTWEVFWAEEYWHLDHYCKSTSLPHAICLAALKAVGYKGKRE